MVGHRFEEPGTGRPYYVNPATGDSQWDMPTASAPTAPTASNDGCDQGAIEMLVGMGFGTEDTCRKMLAKCGNDCNQAIELFLSGEQA